MLTIRLTGILAEEFINEIQIEATSVQEAISFLCHTFANFKHFVLSQNYSYSLVVNKHNWERHITEETIEQVLLPVSDSVITISPVITGSGKNAGKYLGAALMIGAGLWMGGAGSMFVRQLGAGILTSGVSLALTTLFSGNPENKEEQSSLFQVSGYVTKEGTPVPMAFGVSMVKSFQVISYNITTEDKSGILGDLSNIFK